MYITLMVLYLTLYWKWLRTTNYFKNTNTDFAVDKLDISLSKTPTTRSGGINVKQRKRPTMEGGLPNRTTQYIFIRKTLSYYVAIVAITDIFT